MTNDKVMLSDWIHFLSTHRSQSLTLILALVAGIITLFIFIGANFNNPNTVQSYIYDAAILAFVFSVVCLILVYYRYASFKRSFNLLDEIFRDGLSDVEVIRKRWYYPEEKSMWRNFVKNYLPNKMAKFGFISGIIAIIVFIIILPILYSQGLITYQDLINGLLFSICIGVISFGVSAIALGISRHSDDTVTKTDTKIKNLMKAFFMDIAYEFEQTKNQIKNSSDKNFRGYQTWRLVRLLERAIHIKEEVDPSLQEDFVKYYCSGPNNLIEGMRFRKNNLHEALGEEEKGNLRAIYNKLKELDLKNKEIEYPSDLVDDKKEEGI